MHVALRTQRHWETKRAIIFLQFRNAVRPRTNEWVCEERLEAGGRGSPTGRQANKNQQKGDWGWGVSRGGGERMRQKTSYQWGTKPTSERLRKRGNTRMNTDWATERHIQPGTKQTIVCEEDIKLGERKGAEILSHILPYTKPKGMRVKKSKTIEGRKLNCWRSHSTRHRLQTTSQPANAPFPLTKMVWKNRRQTSSDTGGGRGDGNAGSSVGATCQSDLSCTVHWWGY